MKQMTLLVLLIIDYRLFLKRERETQRNIRRLKSDSSTTRERGDECDEQRVNPCKKRVCRASLPIRRYADTLTRPRIPGKAVQALPRAAQTQKRTNKQTNKISLTTVPPT